MVSGTTANVKLKTSEPVLSPASLQAPTPVKWRHVVSCCVPCVCALQCPQYCTTNRPWSVCILASGMHPKAARAANIRILPVERGVVPAGPARVSVGSWLQILTHASPCVSLMYQPKQVSWEPKAQASSCAHAVGASILCPSVLRVAQAHRLHFLILHG